MCIIYLDVFVYVCVCVCVCVCNLYQYVHFTVCVVSNCFLCRIRAFTIRHKDTILLVSLSFIRWTEGELVFRMCPPPLCVDKGQISKNK